jgi:cobalt transporter subunit CbtB
VTHSTSHTVAAARANTAVAAITALVLGVGILFLAGFAWPSYLHNATHDTRHALGLPCH